AVHRWYVARGQTRRERLAGDDRPDPHRPDPVPRPGDPARGPAHPRLDRPGDGWRHLPAGAARGDVVSDRRAWLPARPGPIPALVLAGGGKHTRALRGTH